MLESVSARLGEKENQIISAKELQVWGQAEVHSLGDLIMGSPTPISREPQSSPLSFQFSRLNL